MSGVPFVTVRQLLGNTLTPLGFCILLVLAIMALFSDRRMD